MNDETHIDVQIKDSVLAHTEDFLDVNARIDAIAQEGLRTIEALHWYFDTTGGSPEDFETNARKIEAGVAEKLKSLEMQMRTKHKVIM